MEWNIQTLEFLHQCFLDTLSDQPKLRLRGEKSLSEAADKPNYGLDVLQLVAQPTVDQHIRNLAAVHFKNYVKARWKPSLGTRISFLVRKQIEHLLVSILHFNNDEVKPKFVSELKETLSMISKLDYPKSGTTSVSQLKSSLIKAVKGNDFGLVNEILTTADSMFEKFRYYVKCDDRIISYLNHALDNFAAPLLTTVKSVSAKLSAARSVTDIRQLIETQKLCCSIIYSLNVLVFSDVFVNNVDKWMNEFKKYLTVRHPAIEDSGADGVAFVDELRLGALCILSLYMKKDAELFHKYFSCFVEDVVSLLVDVSASPKRENLIMSAIAFLTDISKSPHHALFSGDAILQKITEKIVIPNVMLNDEDEEMFKSNYVEFMKRDVEGRDHTRRSIVCEILKGIAENYKEKIREKVSEQIRNLLAKFDENPDANWKYKDCAIQLVVYLASASTSTDLVDVRDFFDSVIVPELESPDVNAFPLLKAGALRFFIVYWLQIPKFVDMSLLGDVVRFLRSNVNAVHTYAAICLAQLLLVKVNLVHTRFSSGDIGPILPVILSNLFDVLEKPESEENKYIMKCIMRVFKIADISPDVASLCITRLTTVLNRVSENPKNPLFNHCMFKAIAILLTRACEKSPSLVPVFEAWLLPIVQMSNAKEVLEIFPYLFQLCSLLVDFQQPPLSPCYMYLFDMSLKPEVCNTSTYLPSFICLIQSFIQKVPNERLGKVLEIFNKLVSSPKTEEHAFHILNSLFENLGNDDLEEVMNHIWPSVFSRLQNSKTPMLVKCLIISLSRFLVKHGIQTLEDMINTVKENSFQVILGQFWIPDLKTIAGSAKVNLCAVASTKLICESPLLLDPEADELCGKLLDGIVTLLSKPEEEKVEDEPEVLDFGGEIGYRATFVHLFRAGKKQDDPLKEINDPKHYSVTLFANLSSLFPGRFPSIITKYLSPANQAALLQLCNSYDLAIV